MKTNMRQDKSKDITEAEMHIKEEDEESESRIPCRFCDNHPCLSKDLEDQLVSIMETYGGYESNKKVRFRMYSQCITHIHGPGLGKGVRKKLPDCLQNEIKKLAPEKDNAYTGFIASSNKE